MCWVDFIENKRLFEYNVWGFGWKCLYNTNDVVIKIFLIFFQYFSCIINSITKKKKNNNSIVKLSTIRILHKNFYFPVRYSENHNEYKYYEFPSIAVLISIIKVWLTNKHHFQKVNSFLLYYFYPILIIILNTTM